MKRIAFVCDTPYQLFTALAIRLGIENYNNIIIDLYIDIKRCKKSSINSYYQNLKKLEIFDNVYEINSLSSYCKKLNKIEWIFPRLSLKIGSKWHLKYYKYDCMYVSGPFMLQRNLINYLKPDKVCFFEDGTGSYVGRIGVDLLNKYGRLLQKITKRGPMYIYPVESYLFCPDLYEGEYEHILKKIKFPEDKYDIYNSVFGQFDNYIKYKNKRVVFLSQPVSDEEIMVDQCIIKKISDYKENIIARPHPQDIQKNFNNIDIDRNSMMWEMMCYKIISEDKILLGKYSTAQITPKLLYNKEPFIIFTYYLYEKKNEKIENAINSIRNIYTKKERVFTPKSFEELEKVLKNLLS